jgi:pimeloyl-ACP methyl ester carboxylesterase
MSEPRDLFLEANRLRHHLLEWGSGERVVLLLHGFQEHAHAWDFVAPRLAAAGFRVLALDWRGHGDSEWIGRGGYYHFADYVADLAALVRELGGRVSLVAHSMGGNAALLYAGTEPDRVDALVTIEGVGPMDQTPEVAPERFADWIEDLDRAAARAPRSLTLEEAAQRLRDGLGRFTPEVALHMARHGTRDAGDGTRTWKFDPLHQTSSPQPFYAAQARAFWKRIRAPVLYVEGTCSFITVTSEEIRARVADLGAEVVTLDGVGHHPHLERPDELAAVLVSFLAKRDSRG